MRSRPPATSWPRIQQTATESETTGSSQIAFMNPGGLRADLDPGIVTFREAANVQPFANTLVNMDLTGAQIKDILEAQWQPDGASRPFLKLGASEGFTYTYAPEGAQGSRILEMYLDGEALDRSATYSVTANSFLAAGGDNFGTFAEASRTQDTGQSDLEATVAYFAEFAPVGEPLEVDYSQRAVGVSGLPKRVDASDKVSLDLPSLSMAGPEDVVDDEVTLNLGAKNLGSFPVETTPQTDLPGYDEAGTASASVTVPSGVDDGPAMLSITGEQTGTTALVPIRVSQGSAGGVKAKIRLKVRSDRVKRGKQRPKFAVLVRGHKMRADGLVEIRVRGKGMKVRRLHNGRAKVRFGTFKKPGRHRVVVVYRGSEDVNRGRVTTRFRVVR